MTATGEACPVILAGQPEVQVVSAPEGPAPDQAQDRVSRLNRDKSHHRSEQQHATEQIVSGSGANRSTWMLKDELIRKVMALDGDHDRILKSLCGCGAARDGLVIARRTARNGADVSGCLSGVYRCRKRMCPVCAYRVSIQRFRALLVRAELVQAAHPDSTHVVGAITCHHDKDSDPRQVFDALADMWDEWRKQDWVSGRRRKGRNGGVIQVVPPVLMGYIVCPEDTLGRNGHHPHLQFMATLEFPDSTAACWEDRKRRICDFGNRTRSWFAQNAPRWGLHCCWLDDWWQVLQSSQQAACWYLLKGGTEGIIRRDQMRNVIRTGAAEATLGAQKKTRKGLSIWDMPGNAFARLWHATRGMRWYRVGGIWRTAKAVRNAGSGPVVVPADDLDFTLSTEDVAAIVPGLWRILPRKVKAILAAINEDIRYSREDVAMVWMATIDALRSGLQGKDLLDFVQVLVDRLVKRL